MQNGFFKLSKCPYSRKTNKVQKIWFNSSVILYFEFFLEKWMKHLPVKEKASVLRMFVQIPNQISISKYIKPHFLYEALICFLLIIYFLMYMCFLECKIFAAGKKNVLYERAKKKNVN